MIDFYAVLGPQGNVAGCTCCSVCTRVPIFLVVSISVFDSLFLSSFFSSISQQSRLVHRSPILACNGSDLGVVRCFGIYITNDKKTSRAEGRSQDSRLIEREFRRNAQAFPLYFNIVKRPRWILLPLSRLISDIFFSKLSRTGPR